MPPHPLHKKLLEILNSNHSVPDKASIIESWLLALTRERREAWDGYAAAALIGVLRPPHDGGTIDPRKVAANGEIYVSSVCRFANLLLAERDKRFKSKE